MRLFGKKKAKEGTKHRTTEEGSAIQDQVEDGQFELTHVGPYEIVAPIGSGGMGTVYKAIDRTKDRTIAIKVLDRSYDIDKKRRKRDYLGREVLIAASLNHPIIIKMHKEIVIQEDSLGNQRRCLLMEYIDGHDLKKHIEDRDLSMKNMVDLCIKLCEGLDFLHQNNIVHRDVKPANFLFSRDSTQVKIVDFGLSKSNATWRTRWMKESGGTRLYMSPEQLRKRNLDSRSDIFSFGITMYELFTGRHPCNGTDTRKIQKQIVSSNYKFDPPSKHNRAIPPQLDRIILKALRRKIDRRYQSVTEMLMDLSRLAESRI
jgi:serine/threonine-protein kinase